MLLERAMETDIVIEEEDIISRILRTRMAVVGEGDTVTLYTDPCAPLVLLDGQGNPILAGTLTGDVFILTHSDRCVDGEPVTLNP